MAAKKNRNRGGCHERRRNPRSVREGSRHAPSEQRRSPCGPPDRVSPVPYNHPSDSKRSRSNQYDNADYAPPAPRIGESFQQSAYATSVGQSSQHRPSPSHYDPYDPYDPYLSTSSQRGYRGERSSTTGVWNSGRMQAPTEAYQPSRGQIGPSHSPRGRNRQNSCPPRMSTNQSWPDTRQGLRDGRNSRFDDRRRDQGTGYDGDTYWRHHSSRGSHREDRVEPDEKEMEVSKDSGGWQRAIQRDNERPIEGRVPDMVRTRIPVSIVKDGLVHIPLHWRSRRSSLREWKKFSDAVYQSGAGTDIFSFNLLRHLILSPMSGIAATALTGISRSLTRAPHLINRVGRSIIPINGYPKTLQKVMTVPLDKLFAKHKVYPNGQVTVNGALMLSDGDDACLSTEQDAILLLVENLEYTFAGASISVANAGESEDKSSFLWRGRPFPCSKPPNEKLMVSLDSLYTQIMKKLHRGYKPPRKSRPTMNDAWAQLCSLWSSELLFFHSLSALNWSGLCFFKRLWSSMWV